MLNGTPNNAVIYTVDLAQDPFIDGDKYFFR